MVKPSVATIAATASCWAPMMLLVTALHYEAMN
jgi:hypothetical protein